MKRKKVGFVQADEGLRKLKHDIKTGEIKDTAIGQGISTLYHGASRRFTRMLYESSRRPLGVPKTKKFDKYSYKYYGIYDTETVANEVANQVRYHGNYARKQQYDSRWIVWIGEKYK